MKQCYLNYVNIKQGTDSTERFSCGNTLPLIQRPFGMIAFAPQTKGSDRWWYSPYAKTIEGIRLTHQPSPWIGDYGTLMITPQADVIKDRFFETWTGIREKDTVLRPDYLRMGFLRSGSVMEVANTKRCGDIKVVFQHKMKSCISIFNMMGNAHFEVDEREAEVRGYTDGYCLGKAENFKMFFVVKPRGAWLDWNESEIVENDLKGAGVHLKVKENMTQAEFVLGISYISYEQARLNCKEIGERSFEEVREESTQEWEDYLSLISIHAEEDVSRTFYSCMYRTGLFPHAAFELDAEGKAIHYSPYTGKVHDGVRYVDQGFWDTYRTILPLHLLIRPDLYKEEIESALNDYREGGWLPRWTAPGEVGCMPSTLIDSVMAQAATAGLLERETLEEVFEAMKHHANHTASEDRFGRCGIADYLKLQYVPYEAHVESVNLTLDFAYGDYCIAKVAEALRKEEKEEYLKRALNYQTCFDRETGFMRAKDRQGAFREPFDPFAWGGDYTEGSAWQTLFAVPHDLSGLAKLMGGNENLLEKLDELFATPPYYRVGGYGVEIHEMTEMAEDDFGQCAISNQPSFHLPYIYACFGKTEKTIYWVDRICRETFSDKPDGFPGDEDNGTTAAWYILSCLGLYPMCPADNTWVKIPARVAGTIMGEDIGSFKEKLKEMVL
ncbi:MAG: GH92 family glycosyl hydrolase [Roseburia sp.]|nr:GH92 family glycosyl hydrolase [Roseburia sp.]